MTRNPPPALVTVSIALGAFLVLNWLERRRPLRRHIEPKLRREARNLALGAGTAVFIQLAEMPAILALCRAVESKRWGILQVLGLPAWLEIAAALVLMDYTFYLWHVLMHRVPLLWRFHLVHHADLDLDSSTALRFHFGEEMLSTPWRAAQVALIGLTPLTFSIWQGVFVVMILFHHSEVELPLRWERRLNRLIVTPHMHGIHHSIVQEETGSNWSSGLTLWDLLHGTLRLNVPQDDISIGVPAWREPDTVRLRMIVRMPFETMPPVWQLPEGGKPERQSIIGRPDEMLA